jgi:hypothetical protein
MDKMAKVYIRLRSEIATLTKEYETKVEVLKAKQAIITGAMKDIVLAQGAKSVKTEHGTVMLALKTRYWAGDWSEFHKFVVENNVPELLEKRIAQGNMGTYLEENPGKVPPGLNSDTEYQISVRKA